MLSKMRCFWAIIFVSVCICGVTFTALGEGRHDGKYYFDALKKSIMEIVDEHQGLINQNPDGTIKTKDLTSKTFFRKTYSTFKKIVGADFSPKLLAGEHDPDKIAHILASLLQAGRVTIAKSQKLINTESDGSIKLKKFIPAVFGILTAERFKQKTGVAMKQTTLGRGNIKPVTLITSRTNGSQRHWRSFLLQDGS